jgi:hypothetical protein
MTTLPALGDIMYQDVVTLILDSDAIGTEGGANPYSAYTYELSASVQPDRPVWDGESKSMVACTSYTVKFQNDPNIGLARPIGPGDHLVFGALNLSILGPSNSPGNMQWTWNVACEQVQQ